MQEGGYSHVYAPFCGLAVIEALGELSTRSEDPYEMFIAGQPVCREFAGWQREAIDEQATTLSRYIDP